MMGAPAQAAGAPPGSAPDEAVPLSVKARTILRFGGDLIRVCPGIVTAHFLLSMISQLAIPLAIPILLGQVTNGLVGQGPGGARADLTTPYLLWLVLAFAVVPLGVLCKSVQVTMDSRMEKRIRLRLFDEVMRKPPEFFHGHNPGELTNILTQTTIEAQQALRSLTVDPLLQAVGLVMAVYLIVNTMKQLSPGVVWPVVGAMLVFGIISTAVLQVKANQPVYNAQNAVMRHRFQLTGLVDSAVKAAEEIQAMNTSAHFSQRYDTGLEKLIGLKRRQAVTMEMVNSGISFPTQVVLAFLYGLIVFEGALKGTHVEPGVIVTLAGLTPQVMSPFSTFAALGVTASSSWPAVALVTRWLSEQSRIKDRPDARSIDTVTPTMEARALRFKYESRPGHVFTNLNFTLKPNSITGLVARMGQGKTTFFRLALRLYDPESGQILLGGIPASDFTLKSLRRHIAMLAQFPAFSHDTVRENFLIAKPDATDEEIRKLAEKTGLWTILEQNIGKDPLGMPFAAGTVLSGGQQRLFALTRCLLRNPTFVFLDEPTTNMSTDEKYQLIPVLRAAFAGKTVVVVDHDLPWLTKFVDRFIVLDRGEIAQEGRTEELLQQNGVFSELYSGEATNSAASAT